jgi:hypothetical protein
VLQFVGGAGVWGLGNIAHREGWAQGYVLHVVVRVCGRRFMLLLLH